MSTAESTTTVLEFLQGGALGPALETPLGQATLHAVQDSALAPVLGMEVPEAPEPLDLSVLEDLSDLLESLPALPSVPSFLSSPPTPALPQNTIESVLAGVPLPALPGIEDLFTPLIELGKSLGTGSFAGVDPVGVFNQASALIDQAMSLSHSAVTDVGQTWNSAGSEAAASLTESAQDSGAELSERGVAISNTTAAAAETVQRGNANLTSIAQSFAGTVVAAAPIAWTPPGQAMLIASAAEHMQAAIAAVTETHSEMLGHTAAMNALAGPIDVPAPPVSEALAGAGNSQALGDAASQFFQPPASPDSVGAQPYSTAGSFTDPTRTSAAHAGTLLPAGSDTLWGSGNSTIASGASTGVNPGATTSSGGAWAGGSAPVGSTAGAGPRGMTGTSAAQPYSAGVSAAGMSPASGSAGGASGMTPGAMMGTGARGAHDDESQRTAPGYLVDATDSTSLVDRLPMVAPPVLGAADPDQYLFRDLEQR